jgi:hypothetical protein
MKGLFYETFFLSVSDSLYRKLVDIYKWFVI